MRKLPPKPEDGSDSFWYWMLERDDEYTLEPDDQSDLLFCYFNMKAEIAGLQEALNHGVEITSGLLANDPNVTNQNAADWIQMVKDGIFTKEVV